jgi:DNA replicative helicase MCM subunit Mcm2 (Cdc46/Mcm family)
MITNAALEIVKNYFISLKKSNPDLGSYRMLESIIRIVKGVAKLKLKDIADVDEVRASLSFYDTVIVQYAQCLTTITSDPHTKIFQRSIQILKQIKSPIPLTDLVVKLCEQDYYLKYYLLGDNVLSPSSPKLRIETNSKVRKLSEMLRADNRIQTVNVKPLVLQYKTIDHQDQLMTSYISDTSDTSSLTHINSPTEMIN